MEDTERITNKKILHTFISDNLKIREKTEWKSIFTKRN